MVDGSIGSSQASQDQMCVEVDIANLRHLDIIRVPSLTNAMTRDSSTTPMTEERRFQNH